MHYDKQIRKYLDQMETLLQAKENSFNAIKSGEVDLPPKNHTTCNVLEYL